MKRILVTGANGFTGREILRFFSGKKEFHTSGFSLHSDIMKSDGYTFFSGDMCQPGVLRELFLNLSPDIVINCSAISVPDYCQENREEAYNCNTRAVEVLANLCNIHSAKLIHLSTDFVFSGQASTPYSELDIPGPVNYYGKTKLWGEQAIEEYANDYVIARVELIYGNNLPGQHGNIVRLVESRLNRGESIKVVNDQWRTPTYVGDIAKATELFINNNATGLFHISGKDVLSIYDIAVKTARFLNLPESLIEPVTTLQMGERVQRPAYSALDISKARDILGYEPVSFEEGLAKMYKES